jgi:hypothetical protein
MLKRIWKNFAGGNAGQGPAGAPSFLTHYESVFAPLLGVCALIIETGSMRTPGNWTWDGQSTVLWKEFGLLYESEIHTVDLDPEAARVVRQECGELVQAHTGDSVQIDMLYLDSYDFDAADPFPSAFHHIKELIAVRPCLGPGSIIAIDDNFVLAEGGFTGKGYLADEWFRHLDIPCLHRGHQFVWQL